MAHDGESLRTDGGRAYGGVLGAFPYAARETDSWLFRSYVVVAGLAAGFFTLIFTLALIRLLGATAGARFSIARAFVILVGLGAVAPLVTPVLLVARTHRRRITRRRGYEFGLALAGYLFLFSLYGLVLAAMPASFELDGETVTRPPTESAGLLEPVVGALYALPAEFSLAVPTAAAAVIVGVHYLRR
ncbi:hypothetical protein RYH80_13785 [Halobaculum sp. MBLA0147]|uniref:hypothetical protein n=1 Tax=Halobaculum sp. MBLA0147 TaxID=3079934 RepID=UPI0035260BFA